MAEQKLHSKKLKNDQNHPSLNSIKINLKNLSLKNTDNVNVVSHNKSAKATIFQIFSDKKKIKKSNNIENRRRSIAAFFTKKDKDNDNCVIQKKKSDQQIIYFHHSLTPSTSDLAATTSFFTLNNNDKFMSKKKKLTAELVFQQKKNQSMPVSYKSVSQCNLKNTILFDNNKNAVTTLNDPCSSNSESITTSPTSTSSLHKSFNFKKPCSSVASTIRSTLCRSSLAFFGKQNNDCLETKKNLVNHSHLYNSINKCDQKLVSKISNTSQNINYAEINKQNNLKQSTIPIRHTSSVKKNMKKHFSNARIALRKLSLSSISIGHTLTQSPQSSASAMVSLCSPQTSAGVSPIKNFSYFSEKAVDLNWTEKNNCHQKSGSESKLNISRVFKKKSVTKPIKRLLVPSLSWDPEQRFALK